ncbi:MAG TPA: hypothetical protein VMR79_08705 [Verrucomicrobiae bacterium]|nr:hypothetical protein [Verrucomicrobiae bacterium]
MIPTQGANHIATRPLGAEELDAETFRALGISAEERAPMTR